MTKQPESATNVRIRRSTERGIQDLGWSTNRMTFSFADYYDPNWMGFGPLRVLIESQIDPHSGFSEHPHRNVEILSYVTDGVLRHEDSHGHVLDVEEGDMQLIRAGRRGMRHKETNPYDEPESHYQIWLIPSEVGSSFSYQTRAAAETDPENLQLYASPTGERGSMPLQTDAYVYAGTLSAAEAMTHERREARGVWLQVVRGAVRIDNTLLRSGDGAGIPKVDGLTVEAQEESELLLIDVPQKQL